MKSNTKEKRGRQKQSLPGVSSSIVNDQINKLWADASRDLARHLRGVSDSELKMLFAKNSDKFVQMHTLLGGSVRIKTDYDIEEIDENGFACTKWIIVDGQAPTIEYIRKLAIKLGLI